MFTPADLARLSWKKKQEKQDAEACELSANRHYAYDTDCSHHCPGCCPALALGVRL